MRNLGKIIRNIVIILAIMFVILVPFYIDWYQDMVKFYEEINKAFERPPTVYFDMIEPVVKDYQIGTKYLPGTYFFGPYLGDKFDYVDTVAGISLRYLDDTCTLIEIKIRERK